MGSAPSSASAERLTLRRGRRGTTTAHDRHHAAGDEHAAAPEGTRSQTAASYVALGACQSGRCLLGSPADVSAKPDPAPQSWTTAYQCRWVMLGSYPMLTGFLP